MKYFTAKNDLFIPNSTAPSESAFTIAKLNVITYQRKDVWPSRLSKYIFLYQRNSKLLTASKVKYPLQVYAET